MAVNSKLIIFFILVIALAGAGLVYNRAGQKYRVQVVLAKELHKAMDAMMGDLRRARAATVQGVPADGQWYHEIIFQDREWGLIQYRIGPGDDYIERVVKGGTHLIAGHIQALSFRRQPVDASVVEVQIQAYNNLSLTSNFKIRLQE